MVRRRYLLRILILQFAFTSGLGLSCPTNFNEVHSTCLHFPTFNMTYCEAQEYCASVGGELITGSNYLKIAGKEFAGRPRLYWIGLTDLMEERNASRSGWRWTDGATVPSSASLTWVTNEPGNMGPIEDCVCQYEILGLADGLCEPEITWRCVPMCQPRPLASSISREGFFGSSAIPTGLTTGEYSGLNCSQLLINAESELACAVACRSHSTDQCSAFYFNRAERLCRLVLFTDVNIDLKGEPGWTKMTRQP